jgi:hypothetical protein
MSHWNFRLVDLSDENGDEPYIELREVFYDDEGVPIGHGSPAIGSESVESMREVMRWHTLALDKPVMQKSEFIGSFGGDNEGASDE